MEGDGDGDDELSKVALEFEANVFEKRGKDQFRQNAFGDESCRGLTMRCLLKGFSLDPLLKIMHFLVFFTFGIYKRLS